MLHSVLVPVEIRRAFRRASFELDVTAARATGPHPMAPRVVARPGSEVETVYWRRDPAEVGNRRGDWDSRPAVVAGPDVPLPGGPLQTAPSPSSQRGEDCQASVYLVSQVLAVVLAVERALALTGLLAVAEVERTRQMKLNGAGDQRPVGYWWRHSRQQADLGSLVRAGGSTRRLASMNCDSPPTSRRQTGDRSGLVARFGLHAHPGQIGREYLMLTNRLTALLECRVGNAGSGVRNRHQVRGR